MPTQPPKFSTGMASLSGPDAPKTANELLAGTAPLDVAEHPVKSDPWAGLTEVKSEPDPWAGLKEAPASDEWNALTPVNVAGTYSIDEFKKAKAEDLAGDKDFSPKEFAADHKVELQKDPEALNKAIQVYEAKDKQTTSIGEKAATAITAAPKVGKTLVEAFKQLADFSGELNPLLNPAGAVASIARAAGGGIEPEIKRKEGKLAEGSAAVELGALGTADLARRAGRGIAQKVTGEPIDYRKRFFDDVAATEMTRNAAQANGEVAKALGTDADTLKKEGIDIDPEAVQKLSVVADPTNYIPIAGGVGFIGKVAGKTGKFLLARTLNVEQAAKLASVLNDAGKAVATAKEGAAQVTGSLLEGAGKTLQTTGEGIGKAAEAAGGSGMGAVIGGLAHGTVPGAAAGVAAVKAVPKILSLAGRGTESLGQLVKGARPATALESAVGGAVKGAVKGAAEAGAVTLPLMIGATPEEQENLLGGIGLAGAVRGAGEAAKVGAHAAQNKLAETVYKSVERAETPESPHYGTDGALDAAHAAEVTNLPKPEQTVLNYFRNYLKDSGVEVYALDQDTFTGRTPKAAGAAQAKGFFTEAGEKITPDGKSTPLVRIFLNGSTDAVGHEIFHALESLDPKKAGELRDSIVSSWTPEQKSQFQEFYNTAINGGKPKELWTHTLSDKDVASDVSAEVFSRVLNATDLSGVEPKIQQRAANFLSSVLEKIGVPIEGRGLKEGAGVSTLGVRGSAKNFSDIQSYIKDLSKRVNEGGTIYEGAKPNRLRGAAEVTTESVNPAHPLGVGPKRSTSIDVGPVFKKGTTPVPKEVSVAKAAPVNPKTTISVVPEESPRNIRTTRAAQNDFAAKRAEVTGAEPALKLAKTLGKDVEAKVEQINKSLETGKAVEIEHSGVKSESTAEAPSGRTSRRSEQEAAYLSENLKGVPSSVRESHQKVFVPVRWETVAGKPQLIAMSLDKVLANVHRSVADAEKAKVSNLIPYDTKNGKLTDAAWKDVVSDLQSYSDNQSHGYRGDGQKLVRPTEDIGASIPAEDPKYSPVTLSEDRANFLNLVQGLSPPLTAREVKGAGTPGNVKGQIIAEVNKRTPEIPAKIQPKHGKKQVFESGRTVKETNPLRNQLAEAGVPTRELIEVTERINAPDILSVKDRSDLNISAPVTDIIRGGFLPSGISKVANRPNGFDVNFFDDSSKRLGKLQIDMDGDRAIVKAVDVEEGNTKQGIGTELYRQAKDRLQELGAKTLVGSLEGSGPVQIREKVFGPGNTKYFHRGQEISTKDAIKVMDEDFGYLRAETDLAKSGSFLPGVESIPELASKFKEMTPEAWQEFTTSKGSLTKSAFELGLGLTDKAMLEQLRQAQSELEGAGKKLMADGDFNAAMPALTKAQFFREAYETATDTGSAKNPRVGWRKYFPDAKPPFAETEVKHSFLPAAIEAVSSLPPVPKGHIRLYHGEGGPQGGGTGGSFYASSPVKASSFGPELSWVDVTVDEAKKAWDRAKKSDFSGGDNFILDDELLKRSKKVDQKVEPPTFELD